MSSTISGIVKWFNSKHKYGFITVLSEGEYKNTDLFVHQSNIITKEPCYRFLVAEENVIFEIKTTDNEKHPKQAVNVSGLNGVTLKCEIPRPPRSDNFNNRTSNTFVPRENFGSRQGEENGSRGSGMGRGGSGSGSGGSGGGRGGRGDGMGSSNSISSGISRSNSQTQ